MITCRKCKGKVFVEPTFSDNKTYEAFCIMCGKRWFVDKAHPLFETFKAYVKSVLVA